jgi:DNA polymerase-3 subunit beta
MKLMVCAKSFTAELKSVLPAVAARSGPPMLSGVRLEASEGEVSIEATDLELTARRVVRGDVTVHGAGSVVVPAKPLVKALAAMSEPEIVLQSHSSDGRAGLDVRAGTRTVTLQGWPTDDWPAVPHGPSRVPGLDAHLRPPAPRACTSRIRRPLQPGPAPSGPRAADAGAEAGSGSVAE